MSAGIYKMLCEQGATLNYAMTWKDSSGTPVNLTGFSAAMQVRESKSSDSAILTLSTSNGGIMLGGATGVITLLASASQTSALAEGQYVYDLEINTGSTVVRLLEGAFVISGEVTR